MASQLFPGTIEDDAAPSGLHSPRWLVDELLREQQRITPVEEFAAWHEAAADLPIARGPGADPSRRYRDLIPVGLPGDGEQFAFEVDLDACSGCKACVTACHNLNDLEVGETWRAVGLLHGGSAQAPAIQHVTTACHHCVDPACLKGCPVDAYDKDPITGIVRHLDDQCIGCQYCTFMCPYDVPKYSRRLGIVRKCDMCRTRLAVGEAPACVQSCPNAAIRIAIVNRQEAVESAEANAFLPGAPEPGCTLPTTIYKTHRPLPRNMLPADYFAAAPQHAHWPLILMLVLTQMSVGALVTGLSFAGGGNVFHAAATLATGLLGITASTLHLGRPRYAFRAIIAWRRSWLSREIIAFGLYAVLAIAYAAAVVCSDADVDTATGTATRSALAIAAAAVGLYGVFCSSMIYAVTQRPFWRFPRTAAKFFLSAAVLGLPIALVGALFGPNGVDTSRAFSLLAAIVAAGATKLALDASILISLRSRSNTSLRRTALLLTGELSRWSKHRFAWGAAGIVLPGLVYLVHSQSPTPALATSQVVASVAAGWLAAFIGELCERYLFFAAVVAPKMPGAPSA
ncbi:MAG: molybdopterin oxidoreductase [Planctomycetota bacterium]|nr:MAG: molybdopterin oxidoreductase [Planctomycetota bacterium]